MARTTPWLPMNVKAKNMINSIVGTDLAFINTKIVAFDSHVNSANAHAHTTDNITGLTLTLAGKVSKNGVSGSFTVIDSINFVAQTFTSKVVTYVDGQITSVV